MRAQAQLPVHTTLLKSFMSFTVLYVHRIHKVYWSRGRKNGIRNDSAGPPASLFTQLQSSEEFHIRITYRAQLYIACRHLAPNSARTAYAIAGALFISAQLSTDAVSAPRKVLILVRQLKQNSVHARM